MKITLVDALAVLFFASGTVALVGLTLQTVNRGSRLAVAQEAVVREQEPPIPEDPTPEPEAVAEDEKPKCNCPTGEKCICNGGCCCDVQQVSAVSPPTPAAQPKQVYYYPQQYYYYPQQSACGPNTCPPSRLRFFGGRR